VHGRAHCVQDVSPKILAEAIQSTLEKKSVRPRIFLQSSTSWRGGNYLPAWEKPAALLKEIDVEVIEVAAVDHTNLPAENRSNQSTIAFCPVCQAAAPANIVKKNQQYYLCPKCNCVFTPHIDAAVLQTENNGHSARHDQNQDAIRLQRLAIALGRCAEHVIDFGCGKGEATRFIQSQGVHAIGIDQDTAMQLPDVADDSMDGILMVEVIEHLYEPRAIFQQFNRVLKLGGVIYVESSFADKKDFATWNYLDPAIGHCTVHSVRSVALLAHQMGFGISWMNPNVCCFTKKVELKTTAKNPAPENIEIIGHGIPDPVVTVVVSTYQSEKFIRPCLENLSRQKNFDRCEIIVVDSGSPENERAIVVEFQKKFPNIRYVRTLRETLYGAWNRGLALARGRYWANVNTDDGLHEGALEILAAALDRHAGCALAFGDAVWTSKPNDTFPSENIIRTVRHSAYTPVQTLFYCIPICLQFWRTDSLRQLGGFDASLHCSDDYAATLRMMEARMSAVHVPEILTLFYQNVTGLTQASNRAAAEFELIMNRHRRRLDISNIVQIEPENPFSIANAWIALGIYASKFTLPWEDKPSEHFDFAFDCFHKALELDPENLTAGMNLVVLSEKLKRLVPDEAGLVRRWPKMREWIALFRAGEGAPMPVVSHALVGPVYRPNEWSHRPTDEQLAREPAALHPWIYRIEGRHVYLSEEIFPRPSGMRYKPDELQSAAQKLILLLKQLPEFYAHLGGAGDALLLLASFYDQSPDGIIFSYANNVGAAKALFDAFPKLSKIYFLPQHAEPFFHVALRFALISQLRNCLGAGATPLNSYDVEWKAGLDIEKK
jgi:glycosyltransferase involved in cell wall biosynthesis